MDETEGAIRRGERARALIEDPLVRDALAGIEARCIQAWRLSAAEDVGTRERMFLLIQLVEQFRQHFTSHLATGRLAWIARERAAAEPPCEMP